jgi:hypothetical protein
VPNLVATLRKDSEIEKKLFADQIFFDQPSAARMLFGLLRTLNGYVNDNSASVFLSFAKDNINVIVNCKDDHVNNLL